MIGVLVSIMASHYYKMKSKQAPDRPLRAMNMYCEKNEAYGISTLEREPYYDNVSALAQAEDSPSYEHVSPPIEANDSSILELETTYEIVSPLSQDEDYSTLESYENASPLVNAKHSNPLKSEHLVTPEDQWKPCEFSSC